MFALIFCERSFSEKIKFTPTSSGSEISSEFRKVLTKPFIYPLKFEVGGSEFDYYPPLADNHEKTPWHKMLFSSEKNSSEFVIFDLNLSGKWWVDSEGKKIGNLELWILRKKREISPKKICLNIRIGIRDAPFKNIKEFSTIYNLSNGRYLFELLEDK